MKSSIFAVIGAEMLAAKSGLGYLIQNSQLMMETADMYAGIPDNDLHRPDRELSARVVRTLGDQLEEPIGSIPALILTDTKTQPSEDAMTNAFTHLRRTFLKGLTFSFLSVSMLSLQPLHRKSRISSASAPRHRAT